MVSRSHKGYAVPEHLEALTGSDRAAITAASSRPWWRRGKNIIRQASNATVYADLPDAPRMRQNRLAGLSAIVLAEVRCSAASCLSG